MDRIGLILAAGLGSGCGAVARWLIGTALVDPAGVDPAGSFFWATLLANVLGSFLIGLIAAFTSRIGHWLADLALRQFLMVGLCGGLTTFSVFSLEVLVLIAEHRTLAALAYVTASPALWLTAVWLGFVCGRRLEAFSGSSPELR